MTTSSRQSATSFEAAKRELKQRDVLVEIAEFTYRFSRRIWRYWRSPLQDTSLIASLLFGDFDYVILNPGAAFVRRIRLLRLVLAIARRRGIAPLVYWHDCGMIMERIRSEIPEHFAASLDIISSSGIEHLVVSPQMGRDLDRFAAVQWHVLPNAVSLPQERDTLSPPEDPPLVINVASVGRRKAPELFVDIGLTVCEEHPDVRFVWIGRVVNQTELDAAQTRVLGRGMESRIQFIGPVFPAYEWMSRSSALLLTSRSEAFGLVAAEAMARRREVICFEGTGAEFVVGDAGTVLPRFDVRGAADAILMLLRQDPPSRVSDAARDRYEEMFTPSRFAENLVQLMARLDLSKGDAAV